MGRVRLDLPETFDFSTEIDVRITDINYGGHLGNDSTLSLIHEVRVRFLQKHGYREVNVEGVGMVMTDAVIIYKAEVFYGDTLIAEIGVGDITRSGCDFYYRFTKKDTGKEVTRAKTSIVFFDFKVRKLAETPGKFREKFAK
ncbi:thioesterase [candidate division WOR-3 bacterium RBG_13_43_14]|uniref:Thioesterase n=1 Tax=candidate division WOR-3 bacterium RBG_13_43_14 TaxID=1802590 RepID=A0A1F4UFV2_UNCW3|nr:MAG: thioesterase [candidate division WOR-3 bacterium RBG_13_43_14]